MKNMKVLFVTSGAIAYDVSSGNTFLNLFGELADTELYSLFPAFFGNYQAMRVLQDIGEKNGVKIALLLFAGIWQTV